MQMIYLLQNVPIVQIDIPEPYEAVRVLLDKLTRFWKTFSGDAQNGQSIDLIHFLQHFLQHARFAIVVNHRINQLGLMILRRNTPRGHGEQYGNDCVLIEIHIGVFLLLFACYHWTETIAYAFISGTVNRVPELSLVKSSERASFASGA